MDLKNELELAQTRIAVLEAALNEAADQIDIGIALIRVNEQDGEYEGFGTKKVKQVDIKPTPIGDKYRAIAKGEK